MEWLFPLVRGLAEGSPWLILVATWVGGAGVLIRAINRGDLYTKSQVAAIKEERDRERALRLESEARAERYLSGWQEATGSAGTLAKVARKSLAREGDDPA